MFLGEVVHDGVDRVDELVVGERDALVSRHGAIVIDVVPGSIPAATEQIPYEPNHADGTKNITVDAVDVRVMESGHFACSVPLRNAGAGLAFITDDPRLTHPSRDNDYIGR